MELKAAELMTLEAAGSTTRAPATDSDIAMAKLKATEMLAMVADEAIQIHGGMGLMDELPLERIWRDARIERIWDGTSEIQRHIISRALLRPLGASELMSRTRRERSPVRTRRTVAVLEVTLDRPKANAIDLATSRVMGEVFADFRDDPDPAGRDPADRERQVLLRRLGPQGSGRR